jgi:membrane protein DedA with SNARE-associated domain
MLASIVDVSHIGYPLLFLLVMAESGGLPVPGETALITGGVLASQGQLKIELVILLAATAAIVGDNLGYLIGRKGGRWLLERPGRFHRQRLHVLQIGEPFFERHGPKAVFFGRFILGLRVWASWLAGATRMPWRSFVFWNACGGICWATGVGLLAYFLGHSANNAIQAFGLYGLAAFLLAVGGVFLAHRRHRRASSPAGSAEAEQPNAAQISSQQPNSEQPKSEQPNPRHAQPERAEPPGPTQA